MNSKTAVYVRVSTDEQTVDCQMPDIEALLKARRLKADFVYSEQASAAKKRPAFEKMMADASRGRFSVLVIWAMDRFGRSLSGNLNDFIALGRAGVRVLSVKEPWMDSAGPMRELLIAIFSWVAQQERTRLIERTKAGIANARKNGKKWGRYSTTLKPASLHDEIIDRWVDEGKPDGFRGLAAQLGCSPTWAWKIWRQRNPDDHTDSPSWADSTDSLDEV